MSVKKLFSMFKKKPVAAQDVINHYDEDYEDYEEDSTDRELNDVAKWALTDKKIFNETLSIVDIQKNELESILKDKLFSRKVNDIKQYSDVWNIIAGLKCREEDFREREELQKEINEKVSHESVSADQPSKKQTEITKNEGIYKSIKFGVGQNKPFVYRNK